jgi:hypothetical protein
MPEQTDQEDDRPSLTFLPWTGSGSSADLPDLAQQQQNAKVLPPREPDYPPPNPQYNPYYQSWPFVPPPVDPHFPRQSGPTQEEDPPFEPPPIFQQGQGDENLPLPQWLPDPQFQNVPQTVEPGTDPKQWYGIVPDWGQPLPEGGNAGFPFPQNQNNPYNDPSMYHPWSGAPAQYYQARLLDLARRALG